MVGYLVTTEPNDPAFYQSHSPEGPYRWSFDAVDAPLAWDITKGSSSIRAGINDRFLVNIPLHNEIATKVVWENVSTHGDHGTQVAGVVGAITDNSTDIASIGWNTSLMLSNWYTSSINSLVSNGADIINFSWIGGYSNSFKNALQVALQQGVILVAAAGNNETPHPGVRYPAAYNFGALGQVIAVSGTTMNGSNEENIDNFNYSPGTDPINDPTNAFIDFAAPGTNFSGLSKTATSGTVHIWSGTSISSPIVAGTIALMLSVNDNLTVNEVYDILKNSSEKIDASSNPYDANGWNQYLGYGRINAYQALKYTLENYGGTVTQNLTITNGETWNFAEGVTVTFQNGAQLKVNGTLNVNGTSSNKVTFDFVSKNSSTQNGIKLNYYAEANIDHAIIKNAYRGIWAYRSDLDLNNSEIFNCTYGLYFNMTEPGGNDDLVTNNHIYNCSSRGIYSYYSNGDYSHNQILNNGYAGIYFYGLGNQNMAPDDNNSQSTGHNKITGSYLGVKVYHANPNLGRVNCIDYGGYNHIDCSTEIRLENNSHVYAQKNYWGSSPSFQIWSGSTLDHSYELGSPPATNMIQGDSPEENAFDSQFTPQLSKANNSSELLEVSTSSIPSSYNKSWPLEWKLLYARNLKRTKKYSAVIEMCKDIIAKYPDSSYSYLALDLLHQSYVQTKGKTQFGKFVEKNANRKVKKDIYGMAELLLAMDSKENRVTQLNNLAKKYEGTPIAELILFDKFMYYLNEKNDAKLAEATSDELGKLFPKSESYYDSQRQLGKDVENNSLAPELVKENSEEETTEIPKNYELLGNYPNPFNPSTTISYALPYSSNVELTIYDITGKVVKTFNENVQSAGYQNIVWNGTNQNGSKVSSGVYFYKFSATSLENNGKVYEKTAKLMLLK